MSNRNLEHLRPSLDEIIKAGAHYVIDIPRSNSVKLWIYFMGKKRLVIASKTPSCHRTSLNILANVKRAINELKSV